MKTKKRMGIMLSMLILIVVLIVTLNKIISNANYTSTDTTEDIFKKVNGVLIMQGLEGDIFTNISESVYVQIPVYDFSKELSSSKIAVKNFNIGTVSNFNLSFNQTMYGFDCYTLTFNFIPEKEGSFNLDNLEISIETKNNTYTSKLGNWVFNIGNTENEDLSVIEYSFYENFTGPSSDYVLRYILKNNTRENYDLNKIVLNDTRILDNDINSKTKANDEFEIHKKIDINNNILIKPMLTYIDDSGNDKFMYLDEVLYSSSVSVDELIKMLKDNDML